jgi:hypothetical protein
VSDNSLIRMPQSRGLISSRPSRALIRQHRELQEATGLELEQVAAIEQIESRKMEALEVVAHVGLASTAGVLQHRRLCIEQEPDGVAAYDLMAETTIRAMASRVEAMNRRLG